MKTITERIEALIELERISTNAFARKVGVDAGNLGKMLAGKQNITDSTLRKMVDATGCSFEWLKYGEGEMLKASSGTPDEASPGRKGIPFYVDLPVSAGRLDTIIQDAEPSGWLDIPGVRALALFPVVGCSMKPEINPGDVIGVTPLDTWEHIDPDKAYLIITHDDRMIKHLAPDDSDADSLWCISPNYPKFRIQKSDIHYIYRVTFCGKLM